MNRIMQKRQSIGVLVIGNEILRGSTLDTNSNYIAKKAFNYGLTVSEIQVIPDDKDRIIDAARSMIAKYDLVFTSGGIGKQLYKFYLYQGPTHDDITYASLAEAFQLSLQHDALTIDLMADQMKRRVSPDAPAGSEQKQLPKNFEVNDARKRMALFPTPNSLFRIDDLWVPIVILKDKLHILPGVPSLFRTLVDAYFEKKITPVSPLAQLDIFTKCYEGEIADALSDAQTTFSDKGIQIGSYPKIGNKDYNVKVSIEGPDADVVRQCRDYIAERIEIL